MDRPCSDSHIGIIAKDLTQWEMVAYTLGLSEAEVEEVDRSYKPEELPLKRIKMLMKWKNKYGKEATYERLIKTFSLLKRQEMVERVRELSTTPSSGEVRRLSPFAEQLKMWYEHTDPDPNVWPPIDRGKFCKLALVKIEHVVNAGRGNIISDAGKKRVPIELENIFDEDVSRKELKRKKIILIEGAPGSGKSTLLWYMCQKWKSGEMFQEFSLVIYIKLREYSTTQSSCSVADILPCSRKIKEEAWDEIEAVDGKGVLFLLDGWDELSQSDNSIFKDIIKSSPKHSLLLSTVVVTSRYVSSDELHRLATSRLEMLGFADQEVKECIMDITGNEEAAHALMAALESKPLLLSSMHLPLNTMIIAYVFQLKRSNLPTTLLETFKLLILNCIQRHIFKKMPDEEHEAITSLESLPKELQVSFNSLCELAFCGLLKDEMLFSKEQVKLIPDTLSLLYGHKLYEETGPRTKYSFIHQTIQELLAAMHMSKMPTVDQLKYLKKLFQPRFNAMIQFYAGVTSLQINGTAQILCDRVLSFCDFKGFEADLTSLFIRKYLRIIICNHFTGLGFSEEYSDLQLRNELTKKKYMPDEDQEAVLQSLQHGNNECTKTSVKEIEDGKKSATSFGKETLLMANCFFEAKNSELYEQLKGLELTCILANVTLSPFDCLSLGSLISQSHIRCVQLAGCNLTSSCIKSFKQGLGESSCITDFAIMEPNFTNEQCIIDMSELVVISAEWK